jgi:phosphatidylglycerophosphatase A
VSVRRARTLLVHPAGWIATGFGSGLSPLAPGTVGSLLALLPWWLWLRGLSPVVYFAVLAAAFAVGVWASRWTIARTGIADPGFVVWDEFVGLWLALAWLPSGWPWVVAGFGLFRLFDIWKPWPVRWADRRVHGGVGVMLDDLLAGALALAVLQSVCAYVQSDPARATTSTVPTAPPSPMAATATASRAPAPECLISSAGIGPLALGMRLDRASQAMPRARFTRTSDGEGVALVDVAVDGISLAALYAGEEDPEKPVDMSQPIEFLETFTPACATAEGIHAGSTVDAAVAAYGPIRNITRSEIESREFVEFERQPAGLQFRIDYSGEFADGESETLRHAPGAKILSISVSAR